MALEIGDVAAKGLMPLQPRGSILGRKVTFGPTHLIIKRRNWNARTPFGAVEMQLFLFEKSGRSACGEGDGYRADAGQAIGRWGRRICIQAKRWSGSEKAVMPTFDGCLEARAERGLEHFQDRIGKKIVLTDEERSTMTSERPASDDIVDLDRLGE